MHIHTHTHKINEEFFSTTLSYTFTQTYTLSLSDLLLEGRVETHAYIHPYINTHKPNLPSKGMVETFISVHAATLTLIAYIHVHRHTYISHTNQICCERAESRPIHIYIYIYIYI
jgi:hypothetical protein